jgi:protein required for attachment to host cells
MRKTITWILLADGHHAKFMINDGIGKGIYLMETVNRDIPYSRDLGPDRPGRVFESAVSMRHGVSITDYHQQEEAEFTTFLARYLNVKALENTFARLVLIAPPTTLGILRSTLDSHAKAKVTAEISKDLVHADIHVVMENLWKVMAL